MDIKKVSWFPFSEEPLLLSARFALYMSNPYVILPNDSLDNKWHLFSNSVLGIHHFISDSGISWQHIDLLVLGGRDPFVYYENGWYYLIYARSTNLNLFKFKETEKANKLRTCIEVIYSRDLILWSKPVVLLDFKDIPYASVLNPKPFISNPKLINEDGYYRLYFGASYLKMPDTKVKFSRFIGSAVSEKIRNRFKLENSDPLLEPEPDSKYLNLALGNFNIIKFDSVYYAFTCSAYWDEERNGSFSAISVKESLDGLNFKDTLNKPILLPSEKGWTDKYIKSCNLNYISYERCFYCYFSALSQKKFSAESIGLFLGTHAQKLD